MSTDHDEVSFGLRALFALLCGIWLWVFFPPMQQLGLVTGAHAFIPFLAILIATQLAPRPWVRLVVGFLASELFMWVYYHPHHPEVGGVFGMLAYELKQLFALLSTHQLTDPLQTNLFLFSICIVYWLISYASRRTRLWLFYNGLGVLVLAIVAGNTKIHPDSSLVILCLIAVANLGLQLLGRLQWSAMATERPMLHFFTPLLALVAFIGSMAWALPKAPAVWADPFGTSGPASRFMGLVPGGTGEKFIGYQEQNSTLGGPFQMDHTPVLQVTTPYASYLRGKVYDTYTGKGWVVGTGHYDVIAPGGNVDPHGDFGLLNAPTKTVKQTIKVIGGLSKSKALFGAYAESHVKLTTGKGSAANLDELTLNVTGDWNQPNNQYVVTSTEVRDPSTYLTKLGPMPQTVQGRVNQYSPQLASEYLQLPNGLPPQIKSLTQQVTSGDQTEYQVVTDVSNYLQLNYKYATQGIPVPGKGQDYVNQFLFQSKQGYCNNFSSAMAVMLRTVGIPTRWVTGFTSGSFDTSNPDGHMDTYLIDESDAHSWVEVYFPSVGWIPFDPTPNFQFSYIQGQGQGQSTAPPRSSKPTVSPVKPATAKPAPTPGTAVPWSSLFTWIGWGIAILAGIALIVGVLFRRRLRMAWYLRIWSQHHPSAIGKALSYLYRLLVKQGLLSHPNVTLRQLAPLAKRHHIDAEDFSHLVKTVEANWYGGKPLQEADRQRLQSTWVQWIRRILGT